MTLDVVHGYTFQFHQIYNLAKAALCFLKIDTINKSASNNNFFAKSYLLQLYCKSLLTHYYFKGLIMWTLVQCVN
jgi:hypothetical protein